MTDCLTSTGTGNSNALHKAIYAKLCQQLARHFSLGKPAALLAVATTRELGPITSHLNVPVMPFGWHNYSQPDHHNRPTAAIIDDERRRRRAVFEITCSLKQGSCLVSASPSGTRRFFEGGRQNVTIVTNDAASIRTMQGRLAFVGSRGGSGF